MMAAQAAMFSVSDDSLEKAATALLQGDLVVFPTDTVYGVGADAFNAEAIEKLYVAKDRSADKGIPILISDSDQLQRVTGVAPSPQVAALMTRFWPGPLTLIVSKSPDLPENISPNNGIAVRMPDSDVARALIRRAGGAVAATSANISGQPSALSGADAIHQLGERVALILEDGLSPGGVASTIIDCRQVPFCVLRKGPISAEILNQQGVST